MRRRSRSRRNPSKDMSISKAKAWLQKNICDPRGSDVEEDWGFRDESDYIQVAKYYQMRGGQRRRVARRNPWACARPANWDSMTRAARKAWNRAHWVSGGGSKRMIDAEIADHQNRIEHDILSMSEKQFDAYTEAMSKPKRRAAAAPKAASRESSVTSTTIAEQDHKPNSFYVRGTEYEFLPKERQIQTMDDAIWHWNNATRSIFEEARQHAKDTNSNRFVNHFLTKHLGESVFDGD